METTPEAQALEGQAMDHESEICLSKMTREDNVISNRVPGVKFVLVVLSARGMVYDIEALRLHILQSYPDAVVFFQTTLGKPVGPVAPKKVDLLIDFTGPGQRQGFFSARKLRKRARVAVGRNAGFFRKKIYDRLFDEKSSKIPKDLLAKERMVQRRILNLAGVSIVQAGETPPDRGKSIALELPPMQRF